MKTFGLNYTKRKIAFLWLACLCLLQPYAKAAETEPGLVLKQNSSVIGATVVTITKDHAKLTTRATNLTFLVDQKKIIVFSKASKTFYESSIEGYPGPPMQKLMMISGLSSRDYTLVKTKTGSILGQPTCEYAVQRTFKKASVDIFTNKFQSLAVFTKTGVNARVAMGMSRIYGLPLLSDLPAQLVYEQFGSMVKGVSTYYFQKQDIKISEFKMPNGLKKVASEAALSKEEGLDDLSRF